MCAVLSVLLTANYFRKLVRHFHYSISFDQLFRSAKSVDLCQGAPSIRERSDLHKLAVELLQVMTTTTTTLKITKAGENFKNNVDFSPIIKS